MQPTLPTAPELVVLFAPPPPRQLRRHRLTGRAPAPRGDWTQFIIPNGPFSSRPPDPRNAGARRPIEAVLPRDRSSVWLRNTAIGLSMPGTSGAASDLVLLPGCTALPAWTSVRRGHLLALAPAGGLVLSRVKTGAGNLWSRAAMSCARLRHRFICGDVQAGDLPLGVGVDAGGDQACTSPLSRPRARG